MFSLLFLLPKEKNQLLIFFFSQKRVVIGLMVKRFIKMAIRKLPEAAADFKLSYS